jgi:hypothetical protein
LNEVSQPSVSGSKITGSHGTIVDVECPRTIRVPAVQGRNTKGAAVPLYSPKHLNGNLLCAVDCGTTGPDPKTNDLIHVVILPLRPDYTPNPDVKFFETKIQPDAQKLKNQDKRHCRMSTERLMEYMRHGIDKFLAQDLFEQWFKDLNLPERKRIVPVCHNWHGVDGPFLKEWLSPLSFDYHFSIYVRDTLSTLNYINDSCDFRGEPIPFPMMGLLSLCTRLGIERFGKGDPVEDARCHAEAYRRLARWYINAVT